MIVSSQVRPYAKLAPLPLQDASLCDGFWSKRQRTNAEVSLHHGFRQLERAGNFQNLHLVSSQSNGSYQGPVFMDEDLYKWLEAVAYEIANSHDPQLDALAEETIALLASVQRQDGYLNSYYQSVKPAERWANLDHSHEMYCAGHLIQAAIAHHRATGKANLLQIACHFADLIADTFGPGRRQGTDGHPEIEMALVELYRETGQARYLELAQFLIDQRGQRKMSGYGWYGPEYHQDHVPVRQATTVIGHAVRQLYLTAGIADLYMETGDPALLETSTRLWHDMTAFKMHITGGLGARYDGESFGDAYELPSDRGYLETCSAIANMMWNWRMLLATGEARFADLMERSLYNGFLSGVSLTGDAFFYTNPLQSRSGAARQEWFRVACCPPNVMRQMAALAHYLATVNEQGIQLHHYACSQVHAAFGGTSRALLRIETEYPWNGRVTITVLESSSAPWKLALRVPDWCVGASVAVNGQNVQGDIPPGTYAGIDRSWNAGDVVELDLPMQAILVQPNPRVDALRDSVAIQRGPILFCLEQVDQPAETDLLRVRINPTLPLRTTWQQDLLGGVMTVEAQGVHLEQDGWGDQLYRPVLNQPDPQRALNLTAVPYFAWANRGPGAMRVWIPQM